MAPGDRPDLDRLTAAVDALGTAFADLAVETLTLDTLKFASIQVSRAANMVDGIRADLARKELNLRPTPGIAPAPGRSLDPRGQRPSRQPERDSERADLFGKVPGLGDATRRGDLSGDYADTVNQVTVRGLVDDFARANELDRFQQQRRHRSGRVWTDLENGMVKLFAQFDPETGARIRNAIDEEVDRVYRAKRDDPTDNRSHQHVVSDAIANLILGARATGTSRTELVVLIDLHTLITGDPQPAEAEGDATVDGVATTRAARPAASGRCCETSDGTPLPIEAVRRIACESGIVPAVLNGDGVVLDLGRSQRLASAAQRQALQVMYPTCAFNGCTTSFARCEIHHIDPFGPPTNGETNIDKLVPACQRHHHHIHDHHLKLTLAADTRTLTVTSPDGSAELHPLPTRRRRRPGAEPGDLPRSA